jgi:hypothetical protein
VVGHNYPVVGGIPVFLMAEKDQTIGVASVSLRAAQTAVDALFLLILWVFQTPIMPTFLVISPALTKKTLSNPIDFASRLESFVRDACYFLAERFRQRGSARQSAAALNAALERFAFWDIS